MEVEAHLQNGVPGLAIVGLADRACQEAKHRVRSGIESAELEWPMRRITVNLAPAALRKEGSGFDLPIALAILAASRQFPSDRLSGHAAIGELALDGRLRPVTGVLAAAEGARKAGLGHLLCAVESAAEAALAGVEPIPAGHLAEVVGYLRGEHEPPPLESPSNGYRRVEVPDLMDVRGQERARRALELAAAGGHNLLLAGPPGIGKSMLARRLPGVLPELTRDEALEVTRIHSVVGLLSRERPLVDRRPFRVAASQRVGSRDRRGWSRARGRVKPRLRIEACSFSTSCRSSSDPCSRRCASRWRTARSRSREWEEGPSSRRGSSSSRA